MSAGLPRATSIVATSEGSSRGRVSRSRVKGTGLLCLAFAGLLPSVFGGAGDLRWDFETGGAIYSSPAVGQSGTVYFGSDDGRLYALDTASGSLKWAFDTQVAISSSPSLDEAGNVYFQDGSNVVHAVDATTGIERWNHRLAGRPWWLHSSVAVESVPGGFVYAGATDGQLLCLDRETGSVRWSIRFPSPIVGSPSLDRDGRLYVGTYDGRLHSVQRATGDRVWAGEATRLILTGSPALGRDGTVFTPRWNGHHPYYPFASSELTAYEPSTGGIRWRVRRETTTRSSPIVTADETLVLGFDDGWVRALDGADGSERWVFNANGPILSTPALSDDGTLYVGCADGRLLAIDSASGTQQWVFPIDGEIHSSPAVGPDGTIFVGGTDGHFRAIEGQGSPPAVTAWPKFLGGPANGGTLPAGDVPRIVDLSPGGSRAVGFDVRLEVFALGREPLAYSWSFQGMPIPDATNRQFTVSDFAAANVGRYRVEVSNGLGSVASEPIDLVLGYPLVLSTNGPGRITSTPPPSLDGTLPIGTEVTLEALPESLHVFDRWSGDVLGTNNPVRLVVDRPRFVTAHFPWLPGDQKWRHALEESEQPTALAIGPENDLYLGLSRGALRSLDATTGRLRWTFDPGAGAGSSAPALGNSGLVYVTLGMTLFAVEALDGTERWRQPVGSPIGSPDLIGSPALGPDGSVVVSSLADKIWCLDGITGEIRWTHSIQRDTAGGIFSSASPAIAVDGTVYAPGSDAWLYALDGATGRVWWRFPLSTRFSFSSGSIALGDNGTVYVTDMESLLALDPIQGTVMGSAPMRGDRPGTTIVAPDGTLYAAHFNGEIQSLPPAGTQRWSRSIGPLPHAPALSADGVLYVGHPSTNSLHALDASTGSTLWKVPIAVSNPLTIDSSGTLYVASANVLASWFIRGPARPAVYAIQGNSPSGLAKGGWPKFAADLRNSGSQARSDGPPTVVRQTTNTVVSEGESAILGVLASGGDLQYEWFRNDRPIPGAQSSRLLIAGDPSGNAGTYRVRVSNTLGVVETADMEVTPGFRFELRPVGPGRIEASPPPGTYSSGTPVILRAVPDPGREFLAWGGDVAGTANPTTHLLTRSSRLIAYFSSEPGDLLWTYDLDPRGAYSVPALGTDGTLFLTQLSGRTLALDAATGTLKWAFDTRSELRSSPALGDDDLLYFGATNGILYALEVATGVEAWRFSTGGPVESSPAIGLDGTVFFGSRDTHLYALDPVTGALRWRYPAGLPVESSPVIGFDGTVYAGSGSIHGPEGRVFALHPVTGQLKWSTDADASVGGSLALSTDGTLYAANGNGRHLLALDAASGAKRWDREIGALWYLASPVLGPDNVVLQGAFNGGFMAIAADGGRLLWSDTTQHNFMSSAVVGANGTAYVGSSARQILALDALSGARRWEFSTLGTMESPLTLTEAGTVFAIANNVSPDSSRLYAVRADAGLSSDAWPKVRGDLANTGRPQGLRPRPRITSVTPIGPNLFRLRYRFADPENLGVQASSNLRTWREVEPQSDGDGALLIHDTETPASSNRFYRLVRPQP